MTENDVQTRPRNDPDTHAGPGAGAGAGPGTRADMRAFHGPTLTLTAMGAALVRGPDGAALGQLGAKSVGMLAYVAMQPGQAASRDTLVELLWPRGDADQGRASLRQELRRIKKTLGPLFELALDVPPGQVALRLGRVEIDAALVDRAVAARDTTGLTQVLALYGGAFLAPLAVNEAPFQDWVSMTNSRIEEAAVDALLRLMLLDEAAGRLDRAGAAARKLLSIDLFQEDVHAALIRIHAAAGRIGAARSQLERCRALFIEELGEDPGPALASLIPDALARRAAAAAGRIPGSDALPDAGPNAGSDAGPDAGSDAGPDARLRAGLAARMTTRPDDPRSGRRAAAVPHRPLAFLTVRPAPGADPALAAIAHRVGHAVMAQLGPGCWIDLSLRDDPHDDFAPQAAPDAPAHGGASQAGASQGFARASCRADVTLSRAGGALRADVTCARRPDGAMSGSRALTAPACAQMDPAIAIARLISSALAAMFLAAAEAEAAQEDRAHERATPAAASAAPLSAAAGAAPRPHPAIADGWLALMRAHRLMRGGVAEDLERARDLLEGIVRAHPDMCEGACLLSLAYSAEVSRGLSDAPREAQFRAREMALRAVRRSPAAAWPHHALGLATGLEDDPRAAQSHHLHALRLAPGFAAPMAEIARGLALAGDCAEALAWAERAAAAGPDDPAQADWLHAGGLARFAAHDWDGAAQAGAEAAAAHPGWAPPVLLRAAALRRAGAETGDQAGDQAGGAAADRALRAAAGAVFSDAALRCHHPFVERALTEALASERLRLIALANPRAKAG